MKKLLYALALVLVLASSGSAGNLSNFSGVANIESITLRNNMVSGTPGGTEIYTIPGSPNANIHIYQVWAFCNAGTATMTITDFGATSVLIYQSSTGGIGTTMYTQNFSPAMTITTGSTSTIVLGACSGGNIGTLIVQADQY